MNPLRAEAASHVEMIWLLGAMTVLFFACFSFWTWWAYSKSNRARMDEASLLPLVTGDDE